MQEFLAGDCSRGVRCIFRHNAPESRERHKAPESRERDDRGSNRDRDHDRY